ncbi:MAG TPA: choice-of-anchor tandem repeat GloVer-containing protein [Candidatus Sulfotelmatobacter sp.]
MILPSAWKFGCILLLGLATALVSPAQTFKTLLDFNGANGATPVYTPLIQGRDGNLYGTTLGGGSNGGGTVFKITPGGVLQTIYSFCSQTNCADGNGPYAGLVQGSDGNFYGTTYYGGVSGVFGTVFEITPSGALTTLHSFDLSDGAGPDSGLVQSANGDFYGTTTGGPDSNNGTVFKITSAGSFTTLHVFDSTDGSGPVGTLVQDADGNLYGTTPYGAGYGSIFKITPSGTLTTLHSFTLADGSYPYGGLVQASDGAFYGTTYGGGDTNNCFGNGCGTVFKITPDGTLNTLHIFESTEGANPIAGLIQATDGNFYGTTYAGGNAGGWGTAFEMTSSGSVTTLHSFDGNNGAQPYGAVAQDTNGNIYGSATNGLGDSSQGTIFIISTDLGPFVSFTRNSGKVGQVRGVFGQHFTGTRNVSFNGTSAKFSVKSDTFLVATVPPGASSGFVRVISADGTLKSNVQFRVLP